MIKKFLSIALLFSALSVSTAARAETSSAYSWIAGLGNISFTQGGAAQMPGYVVGSMRDGNISPIMQFVLVNSMMNQCIKDTYNYYPRRRDPFALATAKFNYGLCRINKCFQQGMLVMLLPQLSGKSQYGGADAKDSGQQMGALLAQSFSQGDGCSSGNSSDKGISSALIQAFK